MSTQAMPCATLADLMKVEGKAELINGMIVTFMPSGFLPSRVARKIVRALEDYSTSGGHGEPVADPTGYAFDPPLPSGRQSLCPDASFYTGALPTNPMGFIEGFPVFAVEVRSESDYGPKADREYADKRADYFAAGTRVVWDVDPVAQTVTAYSATAPTIATTFRRGSTADAEPAVPGWRLSVDALFT
ncbi:Uma2 family endonuclease [Gemmata sp. JC673]|uniref:Uma2 family endonuclease n=1 Tax=Gemmata algarum TaxID=2975278 RepID=A0ABU5F5G8_9BACT|nr:Uma2 family endonuclease [Gemmata algarum]MDY3562007.1 Uma2 family endonuclease [Gemmata algarum]